MKRKSLDELFNDLHITLTNKKKQKSDQEFKEYSQTEVDALLKSQEEFLFKEFKKYVETMRTSVDVQIPKWAC